MIHFRVKFNMDLYALCVFLSLCILVCYKIVRRCIQTMDRDEDWLRLANRLNENTQMYERETEKDRLIAIRVGFTREIDNWCQPYVDSLCWQVVSMDEITRNIEWSEKKRFVFSTNREQDSTGILEWRFRDFHLC